jgi:hypothetical protein
LKSDARDFAYAGRERPSTSGRNNTLTAPPLGSLLQALRRVSKSGARRHIRSARVHPRLAKKPRQKIAEMAIAGTAVLGTEG